ncbi:unnamed protein product [Periconia digitata]|uniref:Uncharacterized protein n=1 Tax=Periconia digitata TaxID=1303443 RepID=A0A9W4UC36_9PLEO|nr:unnamed protein product [Periconia digitata]
MATFNLHHSMSLGGQETHIYQPNKHDVFLATNLTKSTLGPNFRSIPLPMAQMTCQEITKRKRRSLREHYVGKDRLPNRHSCQL